MAPTTSEGFFSEGPACQVRLFRIDRSLWFRGHDKRAPPKSSGGTCLSGPFFPEGRACHVRHSPLDDPLPSAGTEVPRGKRG